MRTVVAFAVALTTDVRVGMHLLFVKGSSYMSYSSIEHLLTAQSVKRGWIRATLGNTNKQRELSTIRLAQMSKST